MRVGWVDGKRIAKAGPARRYLRPGGEFRREVGRPPDWLPDALVNGCSKGDFSITASA